MKRGSEDKVIVVSACLAGVRCRYDGKSKSVAVIKRLVAQGEAIPLCPEQLGGLPTPREPAEIVGGSGEDVLGFAKKSEGFFGSAEISGGGAKVLTKDGMDMTEKFIKGAKETLKIAKLIKAEKAILKSKSPSCGYGQIYDGSFSGKLKPGNGVTAALLKRNGIEIFTEECPTLRCWQRRSLQRMKRPKHSLLCFILRLLRLRSAAMTFSHSPPTVARNTCGDPNLFGGFPHNRLVLATGQGWSLSGKVNRAQAEACDYKLAMKNCPEIP